MAAADADAFIEPGLVQVRHAARSGTGTRVVASDRQAERADCGHGTRLPGIVHGAQVVRLVVDWIVPAVLQPEHVAELVHERSSLFTPRSDGEVVRIGRPAWCRRY